VVKYRRVNYLGEIMSNGDREFKLLSAAADFIREDFEGEDTRWLKSPFYWVKKLSSSSKGRFGKQLVNQWLAAKGLSVKYTSTDSEADIEVNNKRVEIKFSTLWQNGQYAFQQIRDQNYDFLICLGISPHDAHCWVITKDLLLQKVIGHMGQHTGATGRDTAWVRLNPSSPPDWMAECGGTLESAFKIIQTLVSR